MPKPIRGSVIVITGASSGIGRAAATAAAQRGANLVLAARQEDSLRAVAAECERLGGHALAVPTDVVDESQVQELARRAVEHFGRIDVWVNNAAVLLFSKFLDAPPDEYRRVIETDLFGYIHGARAALRPFVDQGHGVLINVSSVVAYGAQPYTSAYVCSNHAIRGLTNSLRMELRLDGLDDVHICTIIAASIDTPFFRHPANYTGRAPKASNPIYSPNKVSDAILALIEKPQREIILGGAGRKLVWQSFLTPGHYEKTVTQQVDQDHFQDQPAEPTAGNLFKPSQWTNVEGGWRELEAQNSPRSLATIGLIAGATVAVSAWLALARSRANGHTEHQGWSGVKR
jgi:short-subunit dehydrogenase